jgi:phage/plasmid-associated DNA primase
MNLIGANNYCTKQLTELGESSHATQNMPGKLVLHLTDHRKNTGALSTQGLEILLSIIGGDALNINPKGQAPYTEIPYCKVKIDGNIIPEFGDKTAAMFARAIWIMTRESFSGREDAQLLSRLLTEKTQIAYWALLGLRRLLKRGQYVQPANNLDKKFLQHSQPVIEFVKQECVLSGKILKRDFKRAFLHWCDTRNIRADISSTEIYRDLYANFPCRPARPREDEGRSQVIQGVRLREPTDNMVVIISSADYESDLIVQNYEYQA